MANEGDIVCYYFSDHNFMVDAFAEDVDSVLQTCEEYVNPIVLMTRDEFAARLRKGLEAAK